MKQEEHENYLKELLADYGKGLCVAPQKEGTFYFGRYVTYDEYVEKYREKLLIDGTANMLVKSLKTSKMAIAAEVIKQKYAN